MASKNVENRHSELTEFVRDKWRRSGLGQAEFVAELLGGAEAADRFGAQTLSKFIHGRLVEPPVELIEALARKYPAETSIERLQSMARREPRSSEARTIPVEDDVSLRFLMGHTIWGATFVAAMIDPVDGPLKVKFASFATSNDDDPTKPTWTPSRSEPLSTEIPGPGRAAHSLPLAAPDVIRIMKQLDHEDPDDPDSRDCVHFGLVPGGLLGEGRDKDGRFVRLASVMDDAAACVIIVPADAPLGPDAVSSYEVAEWLNKRSEEGGERGNAAKKPRESRESRVVILAETGTVAAERAKRITSMATTAMKMHGRSRAPMQFTGDHLSTRELRNLSWAKLQEHQPNAAAIVAWEPQASWFVHNSAGQVKRIPLVHVPEAGKRAEPLTFDIYLYIPAEAELSESWQGWRTRVGKAVKRLLREILPTIQAKQDSISQLFRDPGGDLGRLSTYFALAPSDSGASHAHHVSSQEIEEVFGSIRFATSADARGLKSAWFPF